MTSARALFIVCSIPFFTGGCMTEMGADAGDGQPEGASGGTGAGSTPGNGDGGSEGSSTGGLGSSGGLGSGGELGSGGGSGGDWVGSDGGSAASGGAVTATTAAEYYELLCAECHGPTGDGLEGKGPDIKHPIRDYSEWVVRTGRTEADDQYGVFALYYDEDMIAFPTALLPDSVLPQIFDFLDSQPQPTTGQGLFNDYCAACHGPDAQGGLTDRPIVDQVAEIVDLVRGGHSPGEFSNRHEFMPAQTADELSDAELGLITDYVNSL